MKEKLGIEEDISTERAHRTGKIQNMMAQEIKRELSLQSFSTLKTNQGFYILTEKRNYGRKKSF